MATQVTKSLSTDFGGVLNSEQLRQEIIDDGIITTEHYGLQTIGDVVTLFFAGSLSGAELTQLDVVIAAHSPVTVQTYTQTHTAYARKDFYKETAYKDISTYIYDGSNDLGTIKDILCVAYMDAGVDSFSIRIYDDTHNSVIAEKTFTNDDRQSLSLAPLANIPTGKSIITVQIKKTGGNTKQYVYIENIQFRI